MADSAKTIGNQASASSSDPKDAKLSMPRTSKQKPFARHDASYVCTVCKAKFFTKADVEEHFNKHPIVDTV